MCALSHHIREKPNWWEKVKDEVIVEKWREEALHRELEGDKAPSKEQTSLRLTISRRLTSSRKLTPAMVKLCYL